MPVEKQMHTLSPFWWEPGVTQLIAESRHRPESRARLAALVFRPAFRRLDSWFEAAGLKRLNMQAEDIFDSLWARDLATAIDHVQFRDRSHFLRVVLLRARQAAHRAAHEIRSHRHRPLDGTEKEHAGTVNPADAAEHADMVGRALRALRHLGSPRYEIVNLHFFEGMTIRQIADDLKMPRSTVHHELEGALRHLRGIVER